VTDVQTYLRWLTSYVGTQEKPRGSNMQPFAAMARHRNGLAWCATFQVAGARQTGLQLPSGADTASCALNEAAYKRAHRLSTTPHVGSVFFVYFPSLQRVAHTGVVWKIAAGRVHTIEGNSNDDGSREGYEVCLRTRPISRATGAVGIRSYGLPVYDTAAPAAPKPSTTAEELMAKLDDEDYAKIAEYLVTRQTMQLTGATARAIGQGAKEGAGVSVGYLLQYLVRGGGEDATRDVDLRKVADDLAVSVAQLGRNAGTGGVDIAALEEQIVARTAAAVLDGLASRLKS
jgi:hypothetical protein